MTDTLINCTDIAAALGTGVRRQYATLNKSAKCNSSESSTAVSGLSYKLRQLGMTANKGVVLSAIAADWLVPADIDPDLQ